MLKGEAKKDYQCRYMRDRRAKLKLNRALVRPKTLNPVRPIYDIIDRRVPNIDPSVRPTRTIKGIIISRERAMFPKPEVDADGNVIYEEG